LARRHLPRVSAGNCRIWSRPFRDCPVVYDLAQELISHVDGRIDATHLIRSSPPTRKPRRWSWASCGDSHYVAVALIETCVAWRIVDPGTQERTAPPSGRPDMQGHGK